MATDTWLGKAILEQDEPYHHLGQPNTEWATDGYDPAVFTSEVPSYGDALAVRAERVAMVRELLTTVTADDLTAFVATLVPRPRGDRAVLPAHDPQRGGEHHRYAVRDLDVLEVRAAAATG